VKAPLGALLSRTRAFVSDPTGDEEGGQVEQREDGRHHEARQQGPAPLLQRGLEITRPTELFPQVGVHERQDDARQEHREEQPPLLRERFVVQPGLRTDQP
jgi:hypothetical protein